LKTDHAYYTKKSWKIPKGAIRRTDNTMAKRTKHTYKNQTLNTKNPNTIFDHDIAESGVKDQTSK
jgi:hypothetical protein